MASGSNANQISIHDDVEEEQQSQLSSSHPKPPSPEPMHRENFVVEVLAEDDDIASVDPPPPYPNGSIRGSRRSRTATFRSSRRANYQTVTMSQPPLDEVHVVDNPGDLETSPLLPVNVNDYRRRRATSHSSTSHSIHSIGQSVIASSRNVISLFQADPDAAPDAGSGLFTLIKRYFEPLIKRAYYSAIFHLLFINFPYELVAWIYLFVGTLTGTTLLITLPLGVILCFLDLIGARAFARGEIFLQTLFHGPLSINIPTTPNPIFSRMRVLSESDSESGGGGRELEAETSFLKLTYLMFTDPTSYQALFYFLVIKPGITLLIAIGILLLLPPAFILVIPAPAVLRAIRRVGIWQAEIAIDALK